MKKKSALLLALLVAIGPLSACRTREEMENSSSSSSSSQSSSVADNKDMLLEGKSLRSIVDDVVAGFESGAVYNPGMIDADMIRTRYGLADTQVEDYYGLYSLADNYPDQFVAIKARPGMVDEVVRTLEQYRDNLAAQFENNNENYAYDRIRNAQVYTRGDYAFLIAVNSLTPDSTMVPVFEDDNRLVTEIINKSFM